MKELTVYAAGTAVLTDAAGDLLWSSDADEDFLAEFDAFVTVDDADDVADYLEDAGYIDEGEAVDIVESDDDGNPTDPDEDDEDEDEEEEEEGDEL
jgi:hypothetical protein